MNDENAPAADGVELTNVAHPDNSGGASESEANLDLNPAALEAKEIEDGRTEEQAAADAETAAARKAENLANGLDEDGNSKDVDADGKHVDSTGPADGAAYDNKA